jgi:Asp-tRNA(Asn)/Glu-tRNA(Gln) amidotransferase A subunit family amidase
LKADRGVTHKAAIEANRLSARHALGAIRRRELSSVELAQACFARIAYREGAVGAWCHVDRDDVIRQARAADEMLRLDTVLGPLHGLPVGIKDVFDTAGMPSEYGSPSLRGRRPERDADAVARLRAAGAIIMGKTVTSEFGMYAATSCRNPHDRERSAGVSSAGSAAAVADFMVPIALGTQHTASTLLPASFCGAFGFKPSFGFTDMRGSNILVPRLANVGFLARSVDDLALFSAVFSPELETPVPHPPRRLGLVRGRAWPQACDAADALESLCRRLPVGIEEIALPAEFDSAERITLGLLAAHMADRFGGMSAEVQRGYNSALRDLIAVGGKLGAAEYIALDRRADELSAAADGLFANVDALITLSAPGEATPASEPGSGALCMPWSLAGLPTISLPLLQGASGLPIGVQLIGRRGRDADLLSIAGGMSDAVLAKASQST